MRYLKTFFCVLVVVSVLSSCAAKRGATVPSLLVQSDSNVNIKASASTPINGKKGIIYSNAIKGTLQDVLNNISKETKTCIQLSPYAKESKELVGGKFKDTPFEEMLDYLVAQAECDFIWLGHGCYFVDKADSEKLSQVVRIGTYGGQLLVPLIPERWKNLIKKAGEQDFSVTAPPRTIRSIQKWFADVDKPRPQILLNGYIIAISVQEFRELGTTFGTNGILSMSGANKGKWVGNYSIADFAKFVEGNKRISACALQSIIASNEQEAIMKKTGEQYVLLAGDKDRYAQIGKIPSETYFNVKASICPDGVIKIEVKGQISQKSSSGSGDDLPEVSGNYAATTIFVKNGKIGLVGLMTGESKQKLAKHLPLIGRIPFLPVGRHEEVMREDVVFLFLLNPELVENNEFNPDFLKKKEGGEQKK